MKKVLIIFSLLTVFLIGCSQKCEHKYETTKYEVTCTEDGYTLYKCSLCTDSYKADIIPATGHQPVVSTPGYEPTCEESGMTDEYSCSSCNKVIKTSEKIFALGHEYGKWVEINAPTKENDGLIKRVCGNDDSHIEEKTLPKLNNQDYIYNINNPTCTSKGLETFVYTVDSQEFRYEVILEKTPHQ